MAPLLGFFVDWWWGIVAVAGGMFCIWIGATARASVKQRDEARELVEQQRKREDELSRHSDVETVIGELKSLVVSDDSDKGDVIEVLYSLKNRLVSGVIENETSVQERTALTQLGLYRIVQLEQRRKSSGPRMFDIGYWILTNLGRRVILYLDANKQDFHK